MEDHKFSSEEIEALMEINETLKRMVESSRKHSEDLERRMSNLEKKWASTWSPQPTVLKPLPSADHVKPVVYPHEPKKEDALNVDMAIDEDDEKTIVKPQSEMPTLEYLNLNTTTLDEGMTSQPRNRTLSLCTPCVCENDSKTYFIYGDKNWHMDESHIDLPKCKDVHLRWLSFKKPRWWPPDATIYSTISLELSAECRNLVSKYVKSVEEAIVIKIIHDFKCRFNDKTSVCGVLDVCVDGEVARYISYTRILSRSEFVMAQPCKDTKNCMCISLNGVVMMFEFHSEAYVQPALLGMYEVCGRVLDARLVLDKKSHRDIIAWSIMIESCWQNGLYDDSLLLFEELKRSDMKPDIMIVSNILSAYGRSKSLDFGKAVHEFIEENNMMADPYIPSTIVTMYASCCSMDLAQRLYDGLSSKHIVASTALVSGYSRSGKIEAARSIFDQMAEKDLVCWSTMIAGYAESEHPQEALKLFYEMQRIGTKPDQVTMLNVISACAPLSARERTKSIHLHVNHNKHEEPLVVNNALIAMYANYGSLEMARDVFDRMSRYLGLDGDSGHALAHFCKMQFENMKPNAVTFVDVLYACSHAGLVSEGRKYFISTNDEYNITPKQEHYGCLIDLYGRANLLTEALEMVETMPMAPNIVVWGFLMVACRVNGEFEFGKFAAQRVLDLEPVHDGAHVFLSNLYAKSRRCGDVVKFGINVLLQYLFELKQIESVDIIYNLKCWVDHVGAATRSLIEIVINARIEELATNLQEGGLAISSMFQLMALSEVSVMMQWKVYLNFKSDPPHDFAYYKLGFGVAYIFIGQISHLSTSGKRVQGVSMFGVQFADIENSLANTFNGVYQNLHITARLIDSQAMRLKMIYGGWLVLAAIQYTWHQHREDCLLFFAHMVSICTSQSYFLLPRPPEFIDLEDKVTFKGGGMLRVKD